MKEKILCIQLKQIGDVLMITPSIRALAQSKPDAEIHVLTQTPSDQIFRHNSHIRKVHIYPGSETLGSILAIIRKLRSENFTAVIDFYGLPKTAILSRLSGAPNRIGFDKPGRSIFYTHRTAHSSSHTYSALKNAHLLTALNIKAEDASLTFPTGPDERDAAKRILENLNRDPEKPLISVSPVSRRDYKVWPAENFAVLCDYLIEHFSAQILFLWGPGEEHFIEAVRKRMRLEALLDYDIPSIGETVALLENVDLHIGNDNGPMHFAISTGVRTVAIFGRPLARNWTPPNQQRHLSVEYDPGCKESCHYPKCALECIRQVSVEQVLTAVKKQMA